MTFRLPAMRALGPGRLSRDLLGSHPAYAALLADAAATGRWPVWVADRALPVLEPPPDPAAVLGEVTGRDAAAFLAGRWPGSFPGLARPPAAGGADPLAVAARSDLSGWPAHLAVVPATCPADAVAVLGWRGARHHHDDVAGLSAVLRSWENRYGAVLVRIDVGTLWLSVAAPPRTPGECAAVAAEHVAFCPDVDAEDPRPLTYAPTLAGRDRWRFWWD